MRTFLLVVVLMIVSSCVPVDRRTTMVEAPPIAPAGDGVVVSLTWNAPVDLDLYVTDPTWESLYFGNNPTRRGGRLENDVRCATLPSAGAALERACIADPLPGRYRVGVDFIDACGADVAEVSFHVAADFAGTRRDASGVIRREEFRVIALEFEVGSAAQDSKPSD